MRKTDYTDFVVVQGDRQASFHRLQYRPFHVGVASRLATATYVAMVTPILYDNSSSLNDSNSNLKVICLMVDFLKIVKLWRLSTEFYGVGQLFATHHRTQYLNTKV